jgi:hypothetical protein
MNDDDIPRNMLDWSQEPNRTYFSVNISNTPSGAPGQFSVKTAQITDSLSPALLHDVDKYFVCINRFKIPCGLIPTIMARFQPGSTTQTIWSVTLKNNTTQAVSQQFVTWVPSSVSNPSFLYDVTSFLQMVNEALDTAYTAVHGAVTSGSPYFIFDPVDEVISLIADATDYETDNLFTQVDPNISIYCNAALFDQFFGGLPRYELGLNTVNGMDRQFRVQALDTNWYSSNQTPAPSPLVLLRMTQQYPSLSTVSPFATLQILSGGLPIRQTYVQTAGGTSGVLGTSPILRNFMAELGPSQLPNTYLDYSPTYPVQLDMNGHSALEQIAMTCQWTDKYGGVHPVLIPVGESLVVELAFTLKKTSA